jgi:hypothetical protein
MNSRLNPVDVHIGNRLACALLAAGLTAADLGLALGAEEICIRRHIDGTQRISAATMFGICFVLSLRPSWFYKF